MNESRYIEKILSKFSQFNSKPYHEIIGSLIYIIIARRPDICYTVTRLSQDLAKPNSFHLMKAKYILHYLKGTINQSLIFKKSQKPLKLEGFCDSDWGNLDNRKSVSGFYYRLTGKSKKQNSVTLLTCEAEFIAISLASQEALYLRALSRTMTERKSFKNPTTIPYDNQSSIVLEKKTSRSSKIKTLI